MGFQLVTVTDAKFPQTVLDWLRRYKFTRYFKRVYFMGVARYKIGDILIDDKVDNLVEARLNGRIAACSCGEVGILNGMVSAEVTGKS